MSVSPSFSRRRFLIAGAGALLARPCWADSDPEPIIDIHQHTSYHDRSAEDLITHQQTMGVTQTIMLPAGSSVLRPSTHQGKSNGLAARTGGNESVLEVAREHPGKYFFGANEVTDLEHAPEEIGHYLDLGAIVIGEQKFSVQCDSPESQAIYQLAEKRGVPVLLHFQHETYNLGFERFHTMLEKFPKVTFIAHAQTFWANIDANYSTPTDLYPKGSVKPGGLSDRMLSEYPNFYGDMSAGSGLNAFTRDEAHGKAFLERHQDKLMFGSDCADAVGKGEACTGAQIIAMIRRLAGSKAVERKLLYENARRVFRLG